MKMIRCAVALMLLALLGGGVATAADKDEALAASLRKVIEENYSASNRKDAEGTMRSIDSKSPDYASTKEQLPSQFALGVASQLVYFRYIGHDDEFAVARVKLKSTGTSGTDFVNNIVDTMTIFHQEGGAWKIWDQVILGVEIVP